MTLRQAEQRKSSTVRGEQTDLSRVKSLSNFLTSILNMLFYVMILAFWFTNEKERITEILLDQTHEEGKSVV